MKIPIEVQRQANYELARRNFFHYCHVMDSKFFRYDRGYQRHMAREMQDFNMSDEDILVVNVPPRFGKSYMATRFTEWLLGNDPSNKIMTGSYNERLSTNFAKQVRNTIAENKADEEITVYNDIFPSTRIKKGDGSMNLWAIEGQYNSYLATSPTGTATGFGARCFPAGTMVTTDRGDVPIDSIDIGYKVRSYNLKTNEIEYKEVVATQFKKGSMFVDVHLGSKVLTSTEDHLIYTDKGYIKAMYLNNRHKVYDGKQFLPIKSVKHYRKRHELVYDIQVKDNHNFFAEGILVHNCIIIDDLVKNAEEAYNELTLEKQWDWFRNTMLSRLEQGGKIVIIMTRWSHEDLAGRVLKTFPDLGYKLRHIKLQAQLPDGSMLCDDILSERDYELRRKTLGASIASANYQQEPLDEKGKLYNKGFKVYSSLPSNVISIETYIDTADTGTDYLAGVVYARTADDEAFILDLIYTQDDMTVTEPLVAQKLHDHKANVAVIEGNNGGIGFARSVERILKENHRSNRTKIETFHQSKNKEARILSNATWVMEHIYMPEGWEYKHEDAYKALMSYSRKGKNKHDDMPDAITGVAERLSNAIGNEEDAEEVIDALQSLGLGRRGRR